jgi:hypothetical protein
MVFKVSHVPAGSNEHPLKGSAGHIPASQLEASQFCRELWRSRREKQKKRSFASFEKIIWLEHKLLHFYPEPRILLTRSLRIALLI